MVDVVLRPARALETGTDVPGTVAFRQGGSAATTARWLARLGVATRLITSVGRDPAGRALVAALVADDVSVHAAHPVRVRTGRIGVIVEPGGERTFVADRSAADQLEASYLRPGWFGRADALHLPIYSLLPRPLGDAARRGLELAHEAGAIVALDLASIGPLLERGRPAARTLVTGVAPDLLFATAAEVDALLDGAPLDDLLQLAPVVVVKRGAEGATVLARDSGDHLRFEVATERLTVVDTTGAGDAFDAGFLAAWLSARAAGRPRTAALQRAATAGHRAARAHLTGPRPDLPL